jgi:exodeoxyribonuclease V alpha subunit
MVLSAHRRGRGSVSWWNTAINDSFHASFPPVGGARFGVGEAVLVTRNQDHLGVFNGDVGVVILCGDIVTLYFDEERSFPLAMVGHLETAWALTIHKSQGSEYDHVVVVLPEKDSQILTRELLYTGVTRAKQHVTIAGSLEAIEAAVRSPITRVSGLTYRLSTT